MTISEKVAYLKGLAEGMKLDTEESKEGKLISVMIGILEEVGLSIEDMEDNMEAMGEEIDAISDDLSDVEKVVYDEDDEDDEDECGCDEDDDFFEVECPNCGQELVIDEDVLEAGTVECPNCKGKFVIDMGDCEDDGCGCGCGCDHDHDHGDEE
ncbi:CD1247 N-terminal domain-containing protein [uncultured Pseudoflavonifractor sp.]|uniref:CD1247 N-terminal domain-containing protein n=1 Tax=uncultured Pseudoflavonifractor sp. TaxID=1221379 RepID=UPI0025E67E1B|nr:CD1247 N-terminal domain-containing protein [uncultured Pseudoflavonifractor sp.]